MEELVREISSELMISEEKAQIAVEMTANYLCRKLPDFMNDDVEAVLVNRTVEDVQSREVGLFSIP